MAGFDGIRILIVKGFDREFMSKGILRYAQEDFCQIFGISSSQKYENDGGPGIVQIIEMLARSDNPTEDKSIFMKSQIVFWLLAAIDDHAKNFNVFLYPEGRFPEAEMNRIVDEIVEKTPQVVESTVKILPQNFPAEVAAPI